MPIDRVWESIDDKPVHVADVLSYITEIAHVALEQQESFAAFPDFGFDINDDEFAIDLHLGFMEHDLLVSSLQLLGYLCNNLRPDAGALIDRISKKREFLEHNENFVKGLQHVNAKAQEEVLKVLQEKMSIPPEVVEGQGTFETETLDGEDEE